MDLNILIFGLPAFFFILFLLLFVLLKRHDKKVEEELTSNASMRGWNVKKINEGNVWGYLLTGMTDGISWSIEASRIRSRSSYSHRAGGQTSQKTCWHTGEIFIDDGLILIGQMIGPVKNLSEIQNMKGLFGKMIQKVLETMLGEDAKRFSELKEVPLYSSRLQERFMVWATDEQISNKLISSEVEKVLLGMPDRKNIMIKMNQKGLHIELRGVQIIDIKLLEPIIGLGEALVRAYKGK